MFKPCYIQPPPYHHPFLSLDKLFIFTPCETVQIGYRTSTGASEGVTSPKPADKGKGKGKSTEPPADDAMDDDDEDDDDDDEEEEEDDDDDMDVSYPHI